MSSDTRRVLFFGRFQPFHYGHFEALKWLLKRFDEVVVLVGMSDESHTWLNPFTAGERLLMIHETIKWSRMEASRVVTATIHTLRIFKGNALYVLSFVPPVIAVATANPAVARAFRDAGVETVTPPLLRRDKWRGETVRCKLLTGSDDWRSLVPPPVVNILERIDAAQRLRDIVADRLEETINACKKLEQQA